MIEEIIKREAPKNNLHDRNYADALKTAYENYKGLSIDTLEEYLEITRKLYRTEGATHFTTASCIVLYELIKDKKGDRNGNSS